MCVCMVYIYYVYINTHTYSIYLENIYIYIAMKFLDREEGGGNRRTFKHFNNKINKHKRKAAAPHG